MSKELTPLEAFNRIDVNTKNNYVDEFIIIQKALKDYETLKETRYVLFSGRMNGKTNDEITRIRVINKLKALEIIKNKSQIIDFTALAITNNYKDYIQWFRSKKLTNKLTKEEFELLKEILK